MSNFDLAKTAFTILSHHALLGETALAKLETIKIGARIAHLRKDRGMTQKELAEHLGVSQPVVSDYENDVIRLPADVVVELAGVLKVSADELLGLDNAVASTKGIHNRRLNRRLQAIEQLPKRDQEALLRTIDAFVSRAG